ncbi:MAG: Crp/Fnr family transcriptional regulator [Actinomycetota bacterium]|nr:Crp/Fnr family transcriptional regulator [Actinomycetota bacterium]
MRTEEARSLLARTAVFGRLDASALEHLAARSGTRRYAKGQLICHQGEPGDSLFVLAQGLVKIFVSSAEGQELVVAILPPPGVFGELALIDGGPRSASALALQTTSLLSIARTTFLDLLGDHPSLADALLRSLGGMVRSTLERASDFVFLDLQARVAKVLLDLAALGGAEVVAGVVVDLGLTQSDLASMVGGSRSTVNQILRAFESRGYVAVHGRRIILNQPDLLRRRASR